MWAALAGSLGALTFAVVLITTAADRAERLEETGTRVPGVVADFDAGPRGERNWVTFTYSYEGEDLEQRIPVTGRYPEGTAVEVVVDPSDSSRAIIVGAKPQSTPAYWATIVGIVVGLGGLVTVGIHVLSGRRGPISASSPAGLPWRAAILVGGVLLLAAGVAKYVFDSSRVAGPLVMVAVLAVVWILRVGGDLALQREARRQVDPRYHRWGSGER